mgnify:CR=1 FL=1
MTSPRQSRGRLSDRLAGTYPLADTYHLRNISEEMERVTAEVSDIVPAATGLNLPGSPTTVVIDRSQWIDRNVATFSHMTEPARRKLEERMTESGRGSQSAAVLAEKVMAAETRAVLSVLSRRVLGQYELVLPTGGAIRILGIDALDAEGRVITSDRAAEEAMPINPDSPNGDLHREFCG